MNSVQNLIKNQKGVSQEIKPTQTWKARAISLLSDPWTKRAFAAATTVGAAALLYTVVKSPPRAPLTQEEANKLADKCFEHQRANETDKALECFKNVAAENSSDAQIALGVAHLKGTLGLSPKPEQAAFWLKKAAAQGHPDAEGVLSYAEQLLKTPAGAYLPHDKAEEMAKQCSKSSYHMFAECYTKAAEAGSTSAQNIMGNSYSIGGFDLKRNNQMAAYWYEKAHAQGDHKYAEELSSLYRRGLLGRSDPSKALAVLEAAAEKGVFNWQRSLAKAFEKGTDWISASPEKAFHFYQLAAKKGDVDSMMTLGNLLLEGIGCKQDIQEGTKWIKAAIKEMEDRGKFAEYMKYRSYLPLAKHGDAEAQFEAGKSYLDFQRVCSGPNHAEVCKKGRQEALDWIKQSAAQNYPDAMVLLAAVYLGLREGIDRNPEFHDQWLDKAYQQFKAQPKSWTAKALRQLSEFFIPRKQNDKAVELLSGAVQKGSKLAEKKLKKLLAAERSRYGR